MKYLKASVILLPVLLMSGCFPPGGGATLPVVEKCVLSSVADFLDSNKENIVKIYVVPDDKMKVYLDNLNAKRAGASMYGIEADSMLLGLLKGGMVGIVLFKDGCLVPGSVFAGPFDKMEAFLREFKADSILAMLSPGV